jgi:2-(1,2-epoxy-1,2-dihydrophenyl)acetyl-CoA isomerase
MAAALDEDPRAFFVDMTENLHRISSSLLQANVPTIAAVNGIATGFGFGLALSCDLLVASERATFSMAHAQVAQIPDGGGWYLLPRVVGRKRALDLYLNFRELAFAFAHEVAQGPTLAYRHAKRRLGEGWQQPLGEYLEEQQRAIADLATSKDFAEGVRAFLDRRAPKFEGQ